jgi:CRISPR system Cascade subunit CasA
VQNSDVQMNTLLHPTIRVTAADGTAAILTLPEVFAWTMLDRVASFPALRPHQRHAWHSFLVLLAANALHRAALVDPPETAPEWCDLLRRLTPNDEDDAPWCLVGPPNRPALLQPPIPSGALGELKNVVATPDALDMLVTAKNHDLKQAVMMSAQPDDWLFALLTLQTMEGFLGAGNYGISRMNGGFANRAALGIAPGDRPGAHVRRDLRRLLALRGKLRGATGYATDDGLALVWLTPWDGTTSLRQDVLDEWYIEICRRVRLTLADGAFGARTVGSKVPRILPILGGVTGDPWSPIVLEKGGAAKSLTVDARGFGYRRMVDLMFAESGLQPSPLQQPDLTDEPEGLQLVARALVRGQGKTEGLHERRVPLSRRAARRGPGLGAATDPASEAARERVRLAGEVQDRVLKPALLSLFQNGPPQIDFRNKESNRKAETFLHQFDSLVDATFFEDLWAETDQDAPEARQRERSVWVARLISHATGLLHDAEAGAARSSRRRFRASVRASDRLQAGVHFNVFLKPYLEEAKPRDGA